MMDSFKGDMYFSRLEHVIGRFIRTCPEQDFRPALQVKEAETMRHMREETIGCVCSQVILQSSNNIHLARVC